MSAGGLGVAVACTLALFLMFGLEARYQRKLAVRADWTARVKRYTVAMGNLGDAFQAFTVSTEQAGRAIEAFGSAIVAAWDRQFDDAERRELT